MVDTTTLMFNPIHKMYITNCSMALLRDVYYLKLNLM